VHTTKIAPRYGHDVVVTREDSARIETWAAAYAAEALSATFERRDTNTGESIRDFDLLFADGHSEPLEVTVHAETASLQSKARLDQRSSWELEADISSVWAIGLPPFQTDREGSNVPYDVVACERDLPRIVERFERAGIHEFHTDTLRWSGPWMEEARQLLALGIRHGASYLPTHADDKPRVRLVVSEEVWYVPTP
jgi:hypothetical protein